MKKFILIGISSLLIIVGLLGYVIHWAFFDMQRLPDGEFLTESVSPDGTYTVRAYIVNGGATVAYSVRGELIFNSSNKEPENIYWNYREEAASIYWIDDTTVNINEHRLTVPNEKFDFRNQK